MQAAAVQANRLQLSQWNSLIHVGPDAYIVLGHCRVEDLESMLDAHAGDEVTVQFQSRKRSNVERDLRFYAVRLERLAPRYEFGGFEPHVLNGRPSPTAFVGTLRRVSHS